MAIGINSAYYLQRSNAIPALGKNSELEDLIKNVINTHSHMADSTVLSVLFMNKNISSYLNARGIKSTTFYLDRDNAKLDAIKSLIGLESAVTYFGDGLFSKIDNLKNQTQTANRCIRDNFSDKHIARYKKQAEYFYDKQILSHANISHQQKSQLFKNIKQLNSVFDRQMRHFKNTTLNESIVNLKFKDFLIEAKIIVKELIQITGESIYSHLKTAGISDEEALDKFATQVIEATMWVNVHVHRGRIFGVIAKIVLYAIFISMHIIPILLVPSVILLGNLAQLVLMTTFVYTLFVLSQNPGIYLQLLRDLIQYNTGDDLTLKTNTCRIIDKKIKNILLPSPSEIIVELDGQGKIYCPIGYTRFRISEIEKWCAAHNTHTNKYQLYNIEMLKIWLRINPIDPLTRDPLDISEVYLLKKDDANLLKIINSANEIVPLLEVEGYNNEVIFAHIDTSQLH